jgi:outer membrane protein assembly factor BamE (lipoprotein component of BamABCDE complex)
MFIKLLLKLFVIFLFISNCTFNKVVKKHGVRNLEKKQAKLIILESNKNDIQEILGPPSTKSTFDNDIWIFIEREITHQKLIKLGKEKLVTNNVLFLEINTKGILIDKDFYDINQMNDIKLSSLKTESKYSKKSFVYDFLSSMRQKINDPLGKRKKP